MKAMLLAAGLGLRMRPITLTTPKPLIDVGGRSLIDRMLDRVAAAGVESVVINVHHLADKLRAHLAARKTPGIEISDETALLLETGGGVAKALPRLGPGPFLVANTDTILLDGPEPALARLMARWDATPMDALLLLVPTVTAIGYEGDGDFTLASDGRLRRRRAGEITPYLFSGVQILHPRLFEGAPKGAFSLNLLYDRALAAGRLFGVRHDGLWIHVGAPESIAPAEDILADRR
ncbi:MAG: nucleotidyltransferase family protein [Alphaproteobacteria bacterium]|nr:nucleotidyltransferase family protein [Alphaproteobacteria bacterium]